MAPGGDRNTPFFHARASARKRKNSIIRLRTPSGSWCHSRKGIQQIISTYFHELFRSTNPSEESIAEVLRGMNARVSKDMNEALIQPLRLRRHAALKLDLSKAYDSVEWSFLESVLIHLGFHPHFTSLILMCVSIVSYSLMLDEELSHLLVKAESRGELTGVAVSRYGPRIFHLLFADDTLIFSQATEEAMICVGRLLKEFEAASSLVVNLEKSAIAFSRNTPEHLQAYLAGLHLGLPALVGRSKKVIFQNLKDRVWKRLQSWRCKTLSQAGKVVLLQSVVQAMPTYVMACFLLPSILCRELEGLMANFLWDNGYVRRIHWLSWDKYSRGERIVSRLVAGTRSHIGSGGSVRIWTDRWIPQPLTFQVLTAPNTLHMEAKVSELLDENGEWKVDLLHAVLLPKDAEAILGITKSLGGQDSIRWHYERNAKVSPKVRMFAWRVCRNSLPTVMNLARRGVNVSGACPRCGDETEDVLHCLLRCPFARLV
ncbi:UNVERIFIED_CONTAM: hypothetical protein Slati_0503600 [Sesamum latifolium]|uniref:Reverse transcriptase domain-containing protein n=1 Tax=Sesamum latifolium TaxID=2727402 RepID=A0AAW2XXB3_9LAMI